VTQYVMPGLAGHGKFKLDSMASPQLLLNDADDANNADRDHDDDDDVNNALNVPRISAQIDSTTATTTSRNIKSVLHKYEGGGGGSVNSSPRSTSMAPSIAERLVYDAAEMAVHPLHDRDYYQAKNMDVTRIKYVGLIGIVLNGIAYFLSVVVMQFWIQIAVWLVYGCHVQDMHASIAALAIMFIVVLVYYALDFSLLHRCLMHNYATHVVFIVFVMAMIRQHWHSAIAKEQEKQEEIIFVLEIVLFVIVGIGGVCKIIQTVRLNAANKLVRNAVNNEYERAPI